MSNIVAVITGVLMLYITEGEDISTGKPSKQLSSFHETLADGSREYYHSWRALDWSLSDKGSRTWWGTPAYWEVDLQGYYTIDNITLTASTYSDWRKNMKTAYVVVMDKDVELCPDVQVKRCGTQVPNGPIAGMNYTFECDATFPVRFVRIERERGHLNIGHVEVQGRPTDSGNRRCFAYYTKTKGKAVTQVVATTGADMERDCAIQCNKRHDCIHFSYSSTAPGNANCHMTRLPVPANTEASSGSVLFTRHQCQ